uniref:CARDB domain-containing protein n=1 Tax=Thermodesulfobacterium geofontis TaxID=1295609 RepID=A0A7V6CDH2_9BACT
MKKVPSSVSALPDLIVESIWLDNQNRICFKLKNIGLGSPQERDFSLAKLKLIYGSREREYNLFNIDPQRLLYRPSGTVSFATDIELKEPLKVSVEVDSRNNIPETKENNNILSLNLMPRKDLKESPVGQQISSTSEQVVSKEEEITQKFIVSPTLKVIYPNGGEIIRSGEKIVLRWEFSGPPIPVEIAIKNDKRRIIITKALKHYEHEVKFGDYIPPDSYKLEIVSEDGKIKDESDGWFQVVLPEVNLGFGHIIRDHPQNPGVKQVKLRIINRGTKTLRYVFFKWIFLAKDNTYLGEGSAGIDLVYPNIYYDTDWIINVTKGYKVRIFLDPDNKQQEPEVLRYDNYKELEF